MLRLFAAVMCATIASTAGAVMLSALKDWFGDDTPRCWTRLADLFEGSEYFAVTEVDASTHAVRLRVGMLIAEAAAVRAGG